MINMKNPAGHRYGFLGCHGKRNKTDGGCGKEVCPYHQPNPRKGRLGMTK